MSNPKNDKPTSKPADDVLVDYNGLMVGERGAAMPHKHSPLVAAMPKAGVPELVISPGLNMLPRAVFDAYSSGDKSIAALVADGSIKVLETLPTGHALVSAINRSTCEATLTWVLEQLGDSPNAAPRGPYSPRSPDASNEVARAAAHKRLGAARVAPRIAARTYVEPEKRTVAGR